MGSLITGGGNIAAALNHQISASILMGVEMATLRVCACMCACRCANVYACMRVRGSFERDVSSNMALAPGCNIYAMRHLISFLFSHGSLVRYVIEPELPLPPFYTGPPTALMPPTPILTSLTTLAFTFGGISAKGAHIWAWDVNGKAYRYKDNGWRVLYIRGKAAVISAGNKPLTEKDGKKLDS